MNREEIERMARSAIRLAAKDTDLTNFDQEATILDRYEFLYWFAKEVAAAEREACAKLAGQTVCDTHLPTGVKIYGTRAAVAIRARNTP